MIESSVFEVYQALILGSLNVGNIKHKNSGKLGQHDFKLV